MCNIKVILILAICVICGLFLISGRASCVNGSKKSAKTGSSANSTYMINAPSNLSATAVSFSEIQLIWQDNSNNEDGFEIERSTSPATGYSLLATVGAGTTSYSDYNVYPFITYYYRVRAFMNNAWQDKSDYSNEISAIALESVWSVVAAGESHSIGIATNRTLWAWGRNDYGQLGLGDYDNRLIPSLVGTDYDWSIVTLGYYHTLALKTNRTLWAWGDNSYGQLGNGTIVEEFTPIEIGTDSDWAEIIAGEGHTLARKINGSIWAWGDNSFGQLGINNYSVPNPLGNNTDWKLGSCGGSYTIAIKNDGSIWSWGVNDYGQLGLGDINNRNIPNQIGADSNWDTISAGLYHAIACKTNGTLWAWGSDWSGQLGLGNIANRYTPTPIGITSDWSTGIAAFAHSVGFKTNRTIWGWGYNGSGQLGDGTTNDRWTPRQIGTTSDWATIAAGDGESGSGATIAIKTNGTMWGCGFWALLGIGYDIDDKETLIQIGLDGSDWSTVALSGIHVIAIKTNRTIWSWGESYNGSLGLGDESFVLVPTGIGTDSDWSAISVSDGNYYGGHSVAIKTNKTIWAWGGNAYSRLGFGDTANRYTPTQIGTQSDWSIISSKYAHTLARKTDGTIWTWGNNLSGELGWGNINTIPAQVGTDTNWGSIASGAYHSIGQKSNGTLWSWGYNWGGQLGLGDYGLGTDKMIPTQIGTQTDWFSITGAANYTSALKTNGTIWWWGLRANIGFPINSFAPIQFGTDSDWSVTEAGGTLEGANNYNYTIWIKTNGTIWGSGMNNLGQLGLPGGLPVALPTQIGTQSDWINITCGGYHSIVRKTNGTIWSCGRNDYGQLGLGNTINRSTPTMIGQ